MSTPIEELIVPAEADDVEEKFLASAEATGLRVRSWRAGGVYRTILRVIAELFSVFTYSNVEFVKAGFLDLATGNWLTKLAYNEYNTVRIPATFATGQIQLENSGGTSYTGGFAIQPGALQVLSTVTGKAYTNLATVSLNPGDTLLVDVRAVEIGAASSAAAGEVTKLQTPLQGVSCTNLTAIVGADAEKDEDLRVRAFARLSTLSGKGPRGAYTYAVKSAVRGDGSPVNINRSTVVPNYRHGIVEIFVASPSGAPAPSDLPFVVESVEKYARPDSVTAAVIAAVPRALSASITVWATATPGLSAATLSSMVNSALIQAVKVYPIGGIAKPPSTQGYLYSDNIAGIIKAVHPSIFDVDNVGGDLPIGSGEVATLATTLTIRFVS